MSNENVAVKNDEVVVLESSEVIETSQSISYLTAKSIDKFSEEDQKEILDLASQIDVTQKEKVMNYASIPHKRSIQDSMSFLESMKGTEEDKGVVERISALSEQIGDEIGQFHIVPKKKNIFSRIFSKGDDRGTITKKIDSTQSLIKALQEAMMKQIEVVATRTKDAERMISSGVMTVSEIERYLVAGYIACENIGMQIEESNQDTSLTISEQVNLKRVQNGYDNFRLVLQTLEKSRAASAIFIMQNMATTDCLEKLNINFSSTLDSILAMFSQQASSALLASTVRTAVENHKNINQLNASLMADNAQLISDNYKKVSDLITKGIVDEEQMIECAKVLVESAKESNEIIKEYLDSIDDSRLKIAEVIDESNKFISDSARELDDKIKSTEKRVSGLTF